MGIVIESEIVDSFEFTEFPANSTRITFSDLTLLNDEELIDLLKKIHDHASDVVWLEFIFLDPMTRSLYPEPNRTWRPLAEMETLIHNQGFDVSSTGACDNHHLIIRTKKVRQGRKFKKKIIMG